MTVSFSVNGDAEEDEANTMLGEASKFHKPGNLSFWDLN